MAWEHLPEKIHGYDPLTYWALAALVRLHDAASTGDFIRRWEDIQVDPDFAEVRKHVEAFEALHSIPKG